MPSLRGVRVLAFAGIARPDKFFATLREAGAEIVAARGFADHHPFTARQLDRLLAEAEAVRAIPITTAKDAVRLPLPLRPRVQVLRVRLAWEAPEQMERLLDELG